MAVEVMTRNDIEKTRSIGVCPEKFIQRVVLQSLVLAMFMLAATQTASAQLSNPRSIVGATNEMTTLNSQGIRQAILNGPGQMGSLTFHDSISRADLIRPRDPWFAMDKLQHAVFSFFITTGTQYGLVNKLDMSERNALPISIGTSAVTGISKEVYDKNVHSKSYFSYRDLVADGAGILLAVGLILL